MSNQTQLQQDLSTILEAADKWSTEMVDYIAPAMDSEADREEAAKAAGELDDAISRVSAASEAASRRPPAKYAADGSSTLETKAGYAAATLTAYRVILNGSGPDADDTDELETAAVDLLADLAHWASLNELDLQELVERAQVHVAAEAGECFKCAAPVQLLGEAQQTPFCATCSKDGEQ